MLHPDTEVRLVSPEIGHGVFATKSIPKGTLVWVQDPFDQVFALNQVRSYPPPYQEILERYCFRDRDGNWIFCWDNTRYMNHSFQSNCLTTPYGCEIAVRDIDAGEELTNDYGCVNVIEPFDALPEPHSSRTRVCPDDLLRYASQWDKQLEESYRHFCEVAQPLAPILTIDQLGQIELIATGNIKPDSIARCYYDENR